MTLEPILEPPPPPAPRHLSPRTSLWLGARVGWWMPFGDLWGSCTQTDAYGCTAVSGEKLRNYVSAGPMFELDVGMRLSRHYIVYLLWERAELGGGHKDVPGLARSTSGNTDFGGLGLRLSTDPDDTGIVLDIALGARRMRARWEDGTQLQLSDAPLESRLGLGADIRFNESFTLSPMLTVGLGTFGTAEWATTKTVQNAVPAGSDWLSHGWLTLQLGGHFDLLGQP